MVDVGPTQAAALAAGLTEHGWRVAHEHADGAAALSLALQRRGWDAVLYGGDGNGKEGVPARKALALVRLADPHLPFVAVSLSARRGALSSVIRGLDSAAAHVSNPAELSKALDRELESARMRRRVGSAHQFLHAQQTISGHLAAGLPPDALFARMLATLGETLGWTVGVVWRPDHDGSVLRCAAVWHESHARSEVLAFADATRAQEFAPGQGMPGRVWAFRRPSWVPDVSREGRTERGTQAMRAGLMTAVAFPLAAGADCVGVIEFFTRGVHHRSDEVSAMFATVGGQVAQYLHRREVEEAESLRTRGYLDAAGALIVVLDADGRVLLANARACAAAGAPEAELLDREWAPVEGVTWQAVPMDGGGELLMGQTAPVPV
jgi:PAS domain-containing protein